VATEKAAVPPVDDQLAEALGPRVGDRPRELFVGDDGRSAVVPSARLRFGESDAAVFGIGEAPDRNDVIRVAAARTEDGVLRGDGPLVRGALYQFVPDYVYVAEDAGRYLVERGVRTVGIDYLSLGGPGDGAATHRALLEAGVCILEGLDLRRVKAGTFDLVKLPLRIAGCDGAPARVLLRPH
jgi:hypothetical protein